MQLLRLRYLQLKRDLSYWVVIIAAITFFIAKGVSEISGTYCLAFAGTVLLFLYSYHTNRKDLNFIEKYFMSPKKELCFNYNLLISPVSAGITAGGYGSIALGLHACVSLIPFTRLKVSGAKLIFIGRLIPPAQFEWIAGLRKNFYILVPLLLVAAGLSPVKFFCLAALFLLNTIFLGFYNFFEPLLMLNPENHHPAGFLNKKVFFYNKMILLVNGPLLLINSIFQPDVAWYNICFIAGMFLLGSSTIYIKYSFYKPNDDLRFHMDYLFLFASALIPLLLPLAYLLNHTHKKKALRNLSHYMHDNS